MIPIVVGSTHDDISLNRTGIPVRPDILVVRSGGYEAEHLRRAADRFDRFVYLKPSVRILDARFWDVIDNHDPAYLFGRPSCWLGIYDTTTLAPILEQIPPLDKEGSIWWESRIHDLLPMPSIWPDVADRNALRIDMVDGLPELVIGNALVEKRKGTVRCRRCPTHPAPGICPHVMRRFDASAASRGHRLEHRRQEVRAG